MKKTFKTLSIQKKFFYALLISSILVVFIIMLTTNAIMFRNYSAHETDSSEKQLNYITGQLDFYLDSVLNYSRTIVSDPVIQDIHTQYLHKDSDAWNINIARTQVTDSLSHIIQSTNYIHQVTLYDRLKQPLFTTAVFPNGNEAPASIENVYGTWVSTIQNSNVSSDARIHTWSLFRPFFSYLTGEKLGYLEISIPESAIDGIYSAQTTDGNSFFMVNSSGFIESTVNYLSVGDEFKDFDKLKTDSEFSVTYTLKNVLLSRYYDRLDLYVVNQISTLEFLHSILITFALYIGISIICIAVYGMLAHKLAHTITSPIQTLIKHTKTIKQGIWEPIPETVAPSDQDIHSLFTAFNSMITTQEQTKNALLETQKEKNKITLDLLHQQMNPHFLYNTLDNICALAQIGEQETLINMVMSLSAFYRETLSNGKFYITIREELEIINAYLQIMQIRNYNKFIYSINCDEELYSCECIKLLLQPIVENSIYHGIKELDTQGSLIISVFREGGNINITIRDNGIGITEEDLERIWKTDNDHFGIKSIHRRIQIYYGTAYGLQIENDPRGGCLTTITIPERSGNHEFTSSNS